MPQRSSERECRTDHGRTTYGPLRRAHAWSRKRTCRTGWADARMPSTVTHKVKQSSLQKKINVLFLYICVPIFFLSFLPALLTIVGHRSHCGRLLHNNTHLLWHQGGAKF